MRGCFEVQYIYLETNRPIHPIKIHPKTPSKKYVNINGQVSKDKWPSMFRYLAGDVESVFLALTADIIYAQIYPKLFLLHQESFLLLFWSHQKHKHSPKFLPIL